eukprot:CAMPEP_0204568172 /NCGR_PEP_ID=MMETSP0661-20131031/37030_1 /ASSEMBLY_ACC=CAM_ASM_000606 /TAXON_ID=109239 /ORGANISM="Alexandrium margalefi, Strain AMGDE01CS-322" /LENGTH=45 /DNA_ID= /DNA_START= /DNA_END= /DNA_ORIENTATION=
MVKEDHAAELNAKSQRINEGTPPLCLEGAPTKALMTSIIEVPVSE